MATISFNLSQRNVASYKLASTLALITIFYNILEGIVSIFFGFKDEKTIAIKIS